MPPIFPFMDLLDRFRGIFYLRQGGNAIEEGYHGGRSSLNLDGNLLGPYPLELGDSDE